MGVDEIDLWGSSDVGVGARLLDPTVSRADAATQTRAVSAWIVAGSRGGLRGELVTGEPCWIRRNDLPAGKQAISPKRLVGQIVRGLVVGVEPDGRGVRISPRHLAIARFRAAQEAGRRLRGQVVSANRGGLIVEVDGLEAFAPRSELSRHQNADHLSLTGKRWRGWVLAVKSDEILLSTHSPRRQRARVRRRRRFVDALAVGEVRKGRVRQLTSHGAFVRLHRAGVDALVPAAEVRAAKVARRGGVLRQGARLRVRITAVRPGGRHGEAAVRGTFA